MPGAYKSPEYDLLKTLEQSAQYYQNYKSHLQHNLSKKAIDSACKNWTKKFWDKSFNQGCVAIGLLHPDIFYQDTIGMYSAIYVLRYKTFITNYSNANRVVRGGTWQKPDFNHREALHQDSARSDVGFRCLLPYTSIPIKKNYKVNWH